jgi:lipopolysaccharide transport system ATP-binding protein
MVFPQNGKNIRRRHLSMDWVIRAERLAKKYRIRHHRQARYNTLRDTLAEAARSLFHHREQALTGQPQPHAKREDFWALREVSFEVRPGDKLGIIGRNGAGKTTLLKILSRITEPSEGRVEIRGRVASLLEVGTGFHPELTGRENIFLNGAILGMRRREIGRKFDEIVAFAEVEQFLDTPVKFYSSGMYVRLAFAVAAHLEPEILLIDEVLAVGDAAFQKKCLGKMEDVAREGRTLLFVSHNMNAIVTLCNRCIMVQDGKIVHDGNTAEVTSSYHSSFISLAESSADLMKVDRYGSGRAKFTSIKISPLSPDNSVQQNMVKGKDLKIELRIRAYANIREANVAVIVYDAMGYRLIDANTALQGDFLTLEKGREACVEFRLYNLLLKPGKYLLGVWLGQATFSEDIDGITYAASFSVEADPASIKHPFEFPGAYQCEFSQKIQPAEQSGVKAG